MINRRSLLCVAALFALLSSGCRQYSKETVSLSRAKVSLRVPNQQRLIALAADEAVERLDLAPLAGKRVSLTLVGVFPHTAADVLDYIRAQVEGKLARSGAIVVADAASLILPGLPGTEASAVGSIQLQPEVDYRVAIGVSWAGVDTHDKTMIDKDLLLRQVAAVGAGVVVGGLLVALDDKDPDTGVKGSATTVGSMMIAFSIAGGAVWSALQKPTLHIYRLIGRVRLVVNAMPVREGQGFQTIGEGQTELLIDESADEGFRLEP